VFLINSRQGSLAAAHLHGQALSLTYGRYFAEFLEDTSLVRLGLLDLTTCVGLRYGRYIVMLRRFSRDALRLYLMFLRTPSSYYRLLMTPGFT
jgi:hypothetical protein